MTKSQEHSTTAVALCVAQQAASVLANWAGVPNVLQPLEEPDAVTTAKEILAWPALDVHPQPLRLLFDKVNLTQTQTIEHYWPVTSIGEPQGMIDPAILE